MGAMSAYAISFYSGSAWLGVLVAGLVGAVLGALHGVAVQPAAGQRRGDRHRAHLVRNRPRLLPRQAVHPAERAEAAGHRPRFLVELSRGAVGAANQRALRHRVAPRAGHRLHARAHALGARPANRRRELRCGPRHGLQRQLGARDRDDLRRVLRRRRRARFSRSSTREAGTSGSRAGRGSWQSRWSSSRTGARRAACGRRCSSGPRAPSGPALQSVGVSSGYQLFNAVPYALTLGIMVATSSANRRLPGPAGRAHGGAMTVPAAWRSVPWTQSAPSNGAKKPPPQLDRRGDRQEFRLTRRPRRRVAHAASRALSRACSARTAPARARWSSASWAISPPTPGASSSTARPSRSPRRARRRPSASGWSTSTSRWSRT